VPWLSLGLAVVGAIADYGTRIAAQSRSRDCVRADELRRRSKSPRDLGALDALSPEIEHSILDVGATRAKPRFVAPALGRPYSEMFSSTRFRDGGAHFDHR